MMSTFSNDISSEATGPLKPEFHLWHSWAGGLKVSVFHENCLLSLVAMATKSFHRLLMGKIEKMAFTAKLLQIFGRKFYRNVP